MLSNFLYSFQIGYQIIFTWEMELTCLLYLSAFFRNEIKKEIIVYTNLIENMTITLNIGLAEWNGRTRNANYVTTPET